MKKKVTLTVVAVLLVISLIVGISYAYWCLTYTAEKINKITSSCFSMELTNEKNNIVLDDAYPISDEKGKALTPYSFTITNTCDLFASYTINLEMLEGTTLSSQYIKTMINSEAITNLNTLEITDASIDGATESRVLFRGSLGSGDSTDYTLRIWMDSDTPFNEDSMNKIFQGKITVTAEVSTYSPVENGFNKLAEALLVNEYQTTSLSVAKNKIASKQEVDFSKTAPIIEWQSNINNNIQDMIVTKASESAVGSYGIHENAAKIILGTSYEFDSSSGYYKLVDTDFYNPQNVDYSENDYYICGSTITPTVNNSLEYWDGLDCVILYKISNLQSVTDSTINLSSGDSVATKKYAFKVFKYYQTEVESDKSDKGLYESIDDYGTTYYYRGNVTNNYVKFAGAYWQVIRINGDGSVRLLYYTTADNINSTNHAISYSAYNNVHTDPTYMGYMYSNTLNSSYQETIKNDNDSAIKTTLDNWYKTNILDKGHSSYIIDTGFCNDRSLYSGDGYSPDKYSHYNAFYRQKYNNTTYVCTNPTNDLFTLKGNTKGNESLTYPIGLISIDELVYSGLVHGHINKLAFTSVSQNYWTMSPMYHINSGQSHLWYYDSSGVIANYVVSKTSGVRPVINLKGDTEITGGIGTKHDPFIIK